MTVWRGIWTKHLKQNNSPEHLGWMTAGDPKLMANLHFVRCARDVIVDI